MSASLPLQPQSLSAAIADRVRQRILHGEWAPGDDISDGDIASTLGVSRTPVREALKQLCHEGLLTAVPRRGMTVAVLSTAHEHEAAALHALLEKHLEHFGPVAGGLAVPMLAMAAQRLQLAGLKKLPRP